MREERAEELLLTIAWLYRVCDSEQANRVTVLLMRLEYGR